MMMQQPQRNISLLFVIGVLVGYANYVNLDNIPSEYSSIDVTTSRAMSESPHPILRRPKSCQEKLDELDANYDLRSTFRLAKYDKFNDYNGRHAYDFFEPEAICFSDERFGTRQRYNAHGDGPKFVCGVDLLHQKSKTAEGCLVYSVGSRNDVTFEQAVSLHMGCETHTFDPTLREAFVGDEYATFHPWGIGEDGEPDDFGKFKWIGKGIETIMRELGHLDRTLDILKIDCEGCEYDAMPPLFEAMAAGRIKVNQILIELHGKDFEDIREFFDGVDKANMRIFHKERNGWGCSGYKCVEYAIISKEFLREANAAIVC